jgi:deazaflavin-dependent oxidoreductase (nitroreductase family)
MCITGATGIADAFELFTLTMSEATESYSSPDWVGEHTQKILQTGTTEGIEVSGAPVVLLTLRGAKSGKFRYTAVMRVEHEGSYAVVASKGGFSEHPVWYHNIKAHPEFPLQDGTVTKTYIAREASGDERGQWWERAVKAFPTYADLQTKTDREIPVFVLDPK